MEKINYRINPEWQLELPEDYQKRKEGDHLVFWTTGVTLLTTVFAYSGERNREILLANLRAKAEAEQLKTIEDVSGSLVRFGFLQTETIEPELERLALHAFTTAPYGCLQTSFYFDRPEDLRAALEVWKSVSWQESAA